MRCVAIHTGPFTHLDHLGVLSHYLKIPLLVTDEHVLLLAKKFYPMIALQYIPMDALTVEYISCHWDVLFVSGKFFAQEMQALCTLFGQQSPRIVYCPHGNSDKGGSLCFHPTQDICLIYGDHMQRFLERTGAAKQIRSMIKTGNYRLPFYREYKKFYDAHMKNILYPMSRTKPFLIYAPTWPNAENPSPFFDVIDQVIDILASNYNIVILLHPFVWEDHVARLITLTSYYKKKKEVLFLREFPMIYALLSRCIAYLGDYSSIGYDFLALDRPLYFLLGDEKNLCHKSQIFECGRVIKANELSYLEQWLHEDKKKEQRQLLYQNTFGRLVSSQRLWKEIALAIH